MQRRQFLLATTGALAACGLPSARVSPTRSLQRRLRALAVADDDFYRPVLYTWTTVEGIAALRANRKLLTATATTGGFKSVFIQRLEALARDRDVAGKVAETLLAHPALIRRRYAWTAAFATVMGLGKRTYGNSLVRIDLRPEAWIGRFEPTAVEPFSFVDRDGKAVRWREVVLTPERVGAMFHVNAEPAFREYVVCSEAMVSSWSIATADIRAKITAEVELLRDIREAGFSPTTAERAASSSWHQMPRDLESLWHATLAFDNDRYRARKPQLDAILAELAAYDAAGDPLVQAVAYSARSASHSSSEPT